MKTRRKLLAFTLATAMVVAACSGDDDNKDSGGSSGGAGGTLVFGASADPVVLDGAFVSDGESMRVIYQIFETLVTTKPGGTEVEPLLAKSWTASDDGLQWTFNLQTGVKFHDGTDFNAAAVCFNFDRWYNFTGVAQSAAVSYYWSTVFGGFSDGATPSLYSGCEATDDATAVVTLTAPSAAFLAGLAVPAFAIASPDALTKYEADKVGGTDDAPTFDGTFGTEHPIGTGPFKFDSWTPGDKLTIVRNEEYWGTKALLDKVIFKPIADGPARRTALENGEIQGYDGVDPADLSGLKDGGFQILMRPAFNVGYVGFNQAKPPLDNEKIRQAIAYALNRDALVQAKYPEGAEVASQFLPPEIFGWSPDVTQYNYDPEKAKQLIEESGVTDLTIEFYYPSDVSRPYMPDPTANFEAFKADLEAVGFTVVPKTAPWRSGYLDDVNAGNAQVYLLGWTGDYGDPDNFVGTFFRTPQPAWGFDNQEIFDILTQARDTADIAERTALYQEANKMIMDFLPGVPYVHTQPALAFAGNVSGYVPGPVALESFAPVSIG
ncbi:MAG TPA: ABC transporter substrate-binding protein [Ilumatobacteraceae bacterium]|nr:ABC transporter substrate-binding protein [Ilumatobacteraceae bacterium]